MKELHHNNYKNCRNFLSTLLERAKVFHKLLHAKHQGCKEYLERYKNVRINEAKKKKKTMTDLY